MLERIQSFRDRLQKLLFLIVYSSSFRNFGKKSTMRFPFRIVGAKYIQIGRKVHVSEYSWIQALKVFDTTPTVHIENGTYIGRFAHIVGTKKVVIKENVLIADKVYIADNAHKYQEVNVPVKDQRILFTKNVVIGKNSWLGENVCVVGATIGEHCIIGANSVVNTDIPDYSVAVGSPARVIKRYNHSTQLWEKQ